MGSGVFPVHVQMLDCGRTQRLRTLSRRVARPDPRVVSAWRGTVADPARVGTASLRMRSKNSGHLPMSGGLGVVDSGIAVSVENLRLSPAFEEQADHVLVASLRRRH